jgi:hypothetical protein
VRVHFAREHALELELGDLAIDSAEVGLDGLRGARVGFGLREFEQFARFRQAGAKLVECADDAFQLGAFASEFLGPFRLLPDGGIFEFPQDLGQALALAGIVKGTPSAHRSAA